jgi:hypothetical protein
LLKSAPHAGSARTWPSGQPSCSFALSKALKKTP